ncbi:hypothetical protein N7582_003760 [Saccharomyces uvarum]|uniref:25S rRNA (Uridine(2843)-N(3))-methyltransferase n=1 Tax=Saccharomyces uvarum TaxID=230603 RepID=A0AA35J4E8_SACUV|nr:hypothetical protein N7582_003760 [Saccharomyces uvarum]CAI4046228.1 hypothetical protein SUVC_12G1190 [Saccharomyces uvarum]
MSPKRVAQLPVHNEATLPPQEIIDLFKITFLEQLYPKDQDDEKTPLSEQIQAVKADLYNRDYSAAFSNDLKRMAYCCRWSPSRATSYASVFAHFPEVLKIIRCETESQDSNVLCVGGGAGSELVALASIFTLSRDFSSKFASALKINNEEKKEPGKLNIELVDIADWSTIIGKLTTTIKSKWLYDGREAEAFNVNFVNRDCLQMTQPQDIKMYQSLNLITLLFTTNELFTQKKVESIKFLQRLNENCTPGCHLLILESAGSYSHITINNKKFPIQFLIDTILVGNRKDKRATSPWSLVSENDSIWYRMDPKLDYSIQLENMRFFYRLYVKN